MESSIFEFNIFEQQSVYLATMSVYFRNICLFGNFQQLKLHVLRTPSLTRNVTKFLRATRQVLNIHKNSFRHVQNYCWFRIFNIAYTNLVSIFQ